MRRLILLLTLLALYSQASAKEITFKDIPDDHWAKKSVYSLVKNGVTSGYPDGTYRGLKNMTRQEMAVFISNLSKTMPDNRDVKRITEEFKTELSTIKYEKENPLTPVITGQLLNNLIIGNPFTNGEHGPKLNYRLKLSLYENVGNNAEFRANLDTMDTGYNNSTSRDLATKLLDFEGLLKSGNINYFFKLGPGTVTHREYDGTDYSDDYYIFIRPKTSAGFTSTISDLYFMGEYVTRKVDYNGYVGVDEITAKASYTFKNFPILGKTVFSARPRILWTSTERDYIAELEAMFSPNKNFDQEFLFGAGSPGKRSSLYVKTTTTIKNDTTSFKLIGNKVGSEYRKSFDKYEFVHLNSFKKLIIDGSVDIAAIISHSLNKNIYLEAKSDIVMTPDFKFGKDQKGTTLTSEFSLNLNNNNFSFKTFYRTYMVPSKISNIDPTKADADPELSDIFGMDFGINF